MNELDIFMDVLERKLNSLSIPGFEYIAEAVGAARDAVREARQKNTEQFLQRSAEDTARNKDRR